VPAVITETTVELGAKGIMYDDNIGEGEWNSTFPDIPYKDDSAPAKFQVYLADLSVDSLLGSWLEIGDIAGEVLGDQIGSTNITLDASDLDIVFSGFSKHYGADATVDLKLNCTRLHSFTSSEANQDVSVYGTVNLQFWPRFNGTTEKAVDIDLVDIHFIGGIAINGYNATANITTFLVDKINVVDSTIGRISTTKIKLEINTASRLLVPALNGYLQKYVVPIPKNILGVFTISDIFLNYRDGYIYAGATPTFIPPTPDQPVTEFGVVF